VAHEVKFQTSTGEFTVHSMGKGATATDLADALIADASGLGLADAYDREKFESDEPRTYDRDVASKFLDVMVAVHTLMSAHRDSLDGESGPIHLWPHGFDLSFEWFGTRVETYEEEGEVTEYPSQLNFGWYPAGDAYFYSNPWPFEGDVLLSEDLPAPASWHTDGWEGTMLVYADVAGKPDGVETVLSYARHVFELVSPTLMA
jgi:hypothetical protein